MPSLVKRNPTDPNNPYRIGQSVDGRAICGAKTRSGKPCNRPPMDPIGRCNLHGGKSLVGVANPNFVDGSKSKYMLPEPLQELYEEGLHNPDLIRLREEIALLDTRMRQVSAEVETARSDAWWKEVRETWVGFMHAVRTSDFEKQNELLPKLNNLIMAGSDEQRLWLDIQRMIEQRRKLVDTESKRMAQAQQLLTVEQSLGLITAMLAAIREAAYLYADAATARQILQVAQVKYTEILGVNHD